MRLSWLLRSLTDFRKARMHRDRDRHGILAARRESHAKKVGGRLRSSPRVALVARSLVGIGELEEKRHCSHVSECQ